MEQEIIRNYLRLRSPFKVASKMAVDIQTVLDVVTAHPELLNPRPTAFFMERFGGKGRPELRRYVVATKRSSDQWDNDSVEIVAARRDFETGTVELVTGRDGDRQLLYALPRVAKLPRPGYFHGI